MTLKQTMSLGWLAMMMAGLAACAAPGVKPEAEEARAQAEAPAEPPKSKPGTVLVLEEREAGSKETFTTRLFANADYLRIADSRSPDDFILLNRAEQTLYSVNNRDRTILVIRNKEVVAKPPIEIRVEEESQPSSAIPKIDGQQATHYRYLVNGKHCYDVVTLPEDFMPEALAAMREFRQVLAGEHATTVDKTPPEMLDACDLALNIFEPVKHMEHGIPIREWDRHGYQRFLKDYARDVMVETAILELPKDFERYSVGDVLVGNGK
jgi:hypothetical protein